MMEKKYTTSILALGALAGFIIGIVISDFGAAVKEIALNRYLYYKMYRLVIGSIGEFFFHVLLSTAITALLLFILFSGLRALFSKLGDGSRNKIKKLLFFVGWAVLFFPTAWAVNRYFLSYTKYHPISLLTDIGIAVFFMLFIWASVKFLGNGRGEALLRSIDRKKYIKVTAAGLFIILVGLNSVAFIQLKTGMPEGPNIIYIVTDSLRHDHLGYSGYERNTSPTIDELAKEGIVFKKAYSSAPWTKPSVASLFTSLYPNTHNAINKPGALPEEIPTMAEILKNAGYTTLFFSGKNNFIGEKFNFHQGFDYYSNSFRNAKKLIEKIVSSIKAKREKRFFTYIHFMDVHLPYNRNKFNYRFTHRSEDKHFKPGAVRHSKIKHLMLEGKLSEDDKEHIIGLYDGQIRYVDENIRGLISSLKEMNLFENTFLVITSDHGEEFWDHKNFEHGHSLYNELVQVPLILVGNKLKHAVVDTPVRSIDLLPTILKLAGIDATSYNLEGIDILSIPTEETLTSETPIFFMNTLYGPEKYGLLFGNRKLIFSTEEWTKEKNKFEGFPTEDKYELFDISKDPLEPETLVALDSEQETITRMKKMLTEFIDKKSTFNSKRVKLDKKTKDELKSLGYL
jgi:arylsulfatase A-like enzyme